MEVGYPLWFWDYGGKMSRQLVIQLARFGDVLQTGRLLRSLEREGETHLCVDVSLVPLARKLYPGCRVHGVWAHADGRKLDASLFTSLLSLNREVYGQVAALCFERVYNLNHSPLNFALATLFPPETVCGYVVADGQVLRERWMRLAFRWTGQRRFAPLNLVDFWGLLAPSPVSPQAVNPPAAPGGKGLGVVLAGRQARRSLPPEVLAPLVMAVFEALDGPPVFLLGGGTERGLAREVMSHLPGHVLARVRNLTGRTDWDGLCDTLTGLDLLLSPDTGTMHLGARLGVPVCGFFLSSAWAWETGPYGLGHSVWQAVPDCAPCRESAPCPRDVACLEPFRSRSFLRALVRDVVKNVGTAENGVSPPAPPPDLVRLSSGFDELGLIWTPAQPMTDSRQEYEKDAPHRLALRALLSEYAAARGRLSPDASTPDSAFCPENFYLEADWMLPDTRS